MLPGIAPTDRNRSLVRRGAIAAVTLACVALAVTINPAGAEGSTLIPAVGGAAHSAPVPPGRIGVEDRAAVEECTEGILWTCFYLYFLELNIIY